MKEPNQTHRTTGAHGEAHLNREPTRFAATPSGTGIAAETTTAQPTQRCTTNRTRKGTEPTARPTFMAQQKGVVPPYLQ